MKSSWVVHKFGGTSMGGSDRIRGVARLVRAEPPARKGIVVSAMSKVTDALIELAELARKQDSTYLEKLEALKKRHFDTIQDLLPKNRRSDLLATLESDFEDLKEILRGVWLVRTYSDRIVELVSGYGEIWSAQMLNAYLNTQGVQSRWLDARKVLIVEPQETPVRIDWKRSKDNLKIWLSKNRTDLLVITGFVASTPDGIATTLRRNGSDYSASIFGSLLDADAITIWTDVDGVLSADPRIVNDAILVSELSYNEATELAYFGAKVVHPSTMSPAIRDEIPIWIKNTFNPACKGTKISAHPQSDLVIKGFSTIDDMALVNVEGTGMIGVPGVAQRLFQALKEVGVSVVMISQASSEHSICFAVPTAQAALAQSTAERAFLPEIQQGQIQSVDVTEGCSILAMVGDGMVDRQGIAGQFFTALGRAKVNIRAIAQGSSERNISAVIAGADSRRALRAVHSAFYLSNQTISVGLIGPGLIGGTFLKQLESQLANLKTSRGIDLRVRGILSSKQMWLSDSALKLKDWIKDSSQVSSVRSDLSQFVDHVQVSYLPHTVIIDATASAEVPKKYPEWLERGIHIITPNKKANTASMKFYEELKSITRKNGKHYLYQTTVGAGLPLLSTLRDLVQTGDRVIELQGIFSGTLSYIFNSFTGAQSFSEIVKDARARGYTEPDPRDDLSGQDVARKLVILAREMGLSLELSDIRVESLVPQSMRAGSTQDFIKKLPNNDAAMAQLFEKARAHGSVLRYVGTIETSPQVRARVELKEFAQSHAFAQISGSDNIVAFRTQRYDRQPLIVRGPGAGPEVTAGGVFADLLRLASYLGAPS